MRTARARSTSHTRRVPYGLRQTGVSGSRKRLMEKLGTRVWHFDAGPIGDVKGTCEEFAAAAM